MNNNRSRWVSDDERHALADAALAMGRKLRKSVVNIVKSATLIALQRRLEKLKSDYSEMKNRKPGRPRTPGNIEALICQMARKNIWGYKRIHGVLKKLNITISKTFIANILRRNGLPPLPERKDLTWKEFPSRHTEVFLCVDLLTKKYGGS